MRGKLLKTSVALNVLLLLAWVLSKQSGAPSTGCGNSSKDGIHVREADKLSTALDRVDCERKSSYSNFRTKRKNKEFLKEDAILKRTSNCDEYFALIDTFAFEPVTREEQKFPLAFSFQAHKHIGVMEMFLALYFRPTDSYCIHVDEKAGKKVKQAVNAVVGCYQRAFPAANIFTSTRHIPVLWGNGGSILEADLICYRELLLTDRKWKMLASVAGTELPLVSIQRFRERLREAGGNVMQIMANPNKERQEQHWEVQRSGPREGQLSMKRFPHIPAQPVPCNLTVFKGVKAGAFTREFVGFVITDPFAIHYYNWIYDTGHPEEHFVSTLATLSAVRAGRKKGWKVVQRFDLGVLGKKDNFMVDYTGYWDKDPCFREYHFLGGNCTYVKESCNFDIDSEDDPGGILGAGERWTNGICYRAALWHAVEGAGACHGLSVHDVCMLSVEDLPTIKDQGCMIANKFDIKVDANAIMCTVKEIRELTMNYTVGKTQNNV